MRCEESSCLRDSTALHSIEFLTGKIYSVHGNRYRDVEVQFEQGCVGIKTIDGLASLLLKQPSFPMRHSESHKYRGLTFFEASVTVAIIQGLCGVLTITQSLYFDWDVWAGVCQRPRATFSKVCPCTLNVSLYRRSTLWSECRCDI